jgi:cell division protein FtsW (lipid II flippase)
VTEVPTRRRVTHHERMLLGLASLFVILNRVALAIARADRWFTLWPLLLWLVCATGMHLAYNRLLPRRDPLILSVVLLLSGWGLTLVARLAPPFANRQAIWLGISSLIATLIAGLPPGLRILRRFRYTWLLVGLLLLAATLIFGVNPSGNEYAPRLWLGFGFLYFQPSEILKLLLIVFLASYLAEKREIIVTTGTQLGRWKVPALPYIGPLLLMWGVSMILLVWQRDLGAASLFFLIFLSMLYVSTGQSGYVLVGIVMLLVAGIAGYLLYDVVQLRVDTWLNPWPEASERAFQIVQSLLAVAAGGLFGSGVGQGSPTFVPVVHSDFVFAAIAEEWGLLGSLGVMTCIAVLVFRALHSAVQNIDRAPFRALLVTGIGVSLGIQSLLIMAGVLKIIPLTGVTLPFVSYGGSSLLSSFIMIGLLLRISDPETSLRWSDLLDANQMTVEFTP